MKDEESTRSVKPAFSLEDFETGVVSVSAGSLKEVWNKMAGRRNDRRSACRG